MAKTNVRPDFLTEEDFGVLFRSLESGSLLEDKDFHIARDVLVSFVEQRKTGENDLVVLNGLPRHVGQAADVDAVADVMLAVYLDCGLDVTLERIRLDPDGERSGRTDDSRESVERRLRIFRKKRLLLLSHYRAKKVKVVRFKVLVTTRAEDIREWISGIGNPAPGSCATT